MDNRNDLILGAAAGYCAGQVRLFAQSLAQTGFNGRLVLFVHGSQLGSMKDMLRTYAPSLEVDLVRIRSIHEHPKLVRSCLKRLAAAMPAERISVLKRALLRFHGKPHVTRYFYYADYLAAHAGFVRVLLSDVRDVVFQSNPFRDLEPGLHVGMESEDLTIATEPFDRDWMLDAYGESMLRELGHKQVSCSGVTLGDFEAVRRYVDLILREALRLPFRHMKTRIYDQAFHNKLFYCGELGDAHPCQPLKSRIATLGCLDPAIFVLSETGYLLNTDGRVAPIVHQYDRHRVLVDLFEASMPA
ncbi:hypothetical protein QMK61_13300 [Fulvimonas sp. R45]|uniref:hypothetical protein n=1 Tax=Fulvimonas sp. R45 TaxID=3045937 RepID=UPI0026605803|nr:hypothetical protein [Fulvimonas sp. R45]MDO1529809.1 hypothetical protein [Fulvimonas sp. R45]